MLLKQNLTNISCNINCNVEKNNAIVKFGNKCLEGDTTESNIVTEITSCANDTITIDSICQMEAEDTYKYVQYNIKQLLCVYLYVI